MAQSTEIKELAEALSAAQGVMKPANMKTRNDYYKNSYADLGEIIAVSREPLSKNGLSFTQLVISPDGHVGIETILMHKSGQWISTTMTLPLPDKSGRTVAQEAGAILTYLRRYSLAAILGIYAEEDTDGNGEQQQKPKQAVTKQTITQPEPPMGPTEDAQMPVMSLETAMTVTASDGTSYGSMDDEALRGRLIGIKKALAKNGITQEQREEYLYKQSAAVTILNARAKGAH